MVAKQYWKKIYECCQCHQVSSHNILGFFEDTNEYLIFRFNPCFLLQESVVTPTGLGYSMGTPGGIVTNQVKKISLSVVCILTFSG